MSGARNSGARRGEAGSPDPARVDQIEQRVRGAFLKLALQMGGTFAEHPVEDTVVFALCRCVDGAFRACLAPLADLRTADGRPPLAIDTRRHPAILHLLNIIEATQ